MAFKTAEVNVTERQRQVLKGLIENRASTSHQLVERFQIVLMSAEGQNNREQALQLGVDRQRVRRWRRKWAKSEEVLIEAENQGANDEDLALLISEVLSNEKHSEIATTEVKVTARQRKILQGWIRNKASTPYRLVERSRIVLRAAEGRSNMEQARQLGVFYQRVRRWRNRWAKSEERLMEAENQDASDKDLAQIISEVLSDNPRPGVPTKFSAEQFVQIISVACEPPEDSNRPVTHWTPKELADEVIKRKIVESISPRHLDRFLKKRHPAAQKPVLDDIKR